MLNIQGVDEYNKAVSGGGECDHRFGSALEKNIDP